MKILSMIAGLAAGLFTVAPAAFAQDYDEPWVGEIRWWGGNFAPRGWAFCDGQLLAISSNDALFSIYGTIYGGDGRTTFALPDMRGRVPVHAGDGPGLTPRRLGARFGAETVTSNVSTMASHSHTATLTANAGATNIGSPNGTVLGASSIFFRGASDTNMGASSIDVGNTGGNANFGIIQPSLAVNCIVALFGIYPSRS